MRKILVTGGSGFIGSAVVRKALEMNFEVLNIDKLTYAHSPDAHKLFSHYKNYSFEKVDICDGKFLTEILSNFQPTAVVHLAAETHVDNSIAEPSEFIHTNILGTFSLLQAIKHFQAKYANTIKKIIHVSTDEVFGSLGEDGSFNENSPYDPQSPYSASKAASDHLMSAWNNTYDLPIIITNCSNNFGPYQHEEKLIPKVIHNLLCQQKVPIYGLGNQVRDWLYVDDHADAILAILQKGQLGERYLIGTRHELKNIDLVKMICERFDVLRPIGHPHQEFIDFVTDRPGHDFRYSIDPSKLYNKLFWAPKHQFDDALNNTIEFYFKRLRK